MPGRDGVSRLSPYLHLGCVSARELEQLATAGEGPAAFRRQLCWRDFYAHVLLHFPANTRAEHQPRYRGTLEFSRARRLFDAWREGRTGYPLVDAGMRQLLREGWMHNQTRLLAGSFLTKDLGIDWRWGERWFMRLLLDGDQASNNGNWQWIASVGVDPQPPYRRIYNPVRQQARFDPHGTYVHRYLPELRAGPRRVPRRTVEDAGRGPAAGRVRHRPRLPGADRRPRPRQAPRACALRGGELPISRLGELDRLADQRSRQGVRPGTHARRPNRPRRDLPTRSRCSACSTDNRRQIVPRLRTCSLT